MHRIALFLFLRLHLGMEDSRFQAYMRGALGIESYGDVEEKKGGHFRALFRNSSTSPKRLTKQVATRNSQLYHWQIGSLGRVGSL